MQLSKHLLMYAQIGPVLGTVCVGQRWGHEGVCACETVWWESIAGCVYDVWLYSHVLVLCMGGLCMVCMIGTCVAVYV